MPNPQSAPCPNCGLRVAALPVDGGVYRFEEHIPGVRGDDVEPVKRPDGMCATSGTIVTDPDSGEAQTWEPDAVGDPGERHAGSGDGSLSSEVAPQPPAPHSAGQGEQLDPANPDPLPEYPATIEPIVLPDSDAPILMVFGLMPGVTAEGAQLVDYIGRQLASDFSERWPGRWIGGVTLPPEVSLDILTEQELASIGLMRVEVNAEQVMAYRISQWLRGHAPAKLSKARAEAWAAAADAVMDYPSPKPKETTDGST